MKQLTRKAYAKINLGLDVLRRRPDGYHEVKMIMQTVGLYDTLTFEKNDSGAVTLEIVNRPELSAGEDNLILRAAHLLLNRAKEDGKKVEGGVRICLEKNIPIAAGMAGGSTDGAAAFLGINELYELGYSIRELQEMGVKLGADIPYCIAGGTMLSEGIGEVLTPLPAPPQAHLVIAKPNLMVSTKYVYENLQANALTEHPDIDGMVLSIRQGDLEGIVSRLGNVLERVTCREYEIIPNYKKILMEEGALGALMSGSGPTVFAIFDDREKAHAGAERILEMGETKEVFVTEFV